MSQLTRHGFCGVALWFILFGLTTLGVFPNSWEAFAMARLIPLSAIALAVVLVAFASTQRRLDIEVTQLAQTQADNSGRLDRLIREGTNS